MTDSDSILQIVSRASLTRDYISLQSVSDAFIASVDAKDNISLYVRSVDKIEEMTGMDFFSELPDEIENTIESAYDLSFWPHARH